MSSYDAGEAFLSVLPSMRGFTRRLQRELTGVRVELEVPVTIDRSSLAALREVGRRLPAIVLTADSTPADRRVAALGDRIEALSGRRIGLDITADQVRAEIDAIGRDLDGLAASDATASVRLDAAAARAELAGVQRQVSGLDGRRINVRVVVDAVQATLSLARLALAVNAFANRDYRFRVDVDTAGAVLRIGVLASLVFGLGGATGTILGLGGAIAGLGAAGAVAVAGIAPTVLAFRGVFDAVKALSAQQETAAVDAQAAAQKQAAAAAAVESATNRKAAAERNAGRARADAARQVAEADARLRRETADLEREQRELTSAWEAGRRSLQDLQDQVDGNALDQRQAAFDLEDARKALTEAQATGDADQIARAQLAVDRQIESMDQLAKRSERAAADNAAAQAAGVAGSDQVVAANERIAAAEQRVTDARAAVDQARVDGAERVADAELQVIEAQRALTQALAQTGETGSSAAQKVEQAFADLSPEAASFARYLFSLKPLLDELSATAAARFFPPLRDGMDSLIERAPLINGLVGQLAGAMGVGLGGVLTQLASPYWTSFFQLVGDAGTTLIPALFNSLLTLAGAGTEVLRVLLPLAPAGLAILDQFSALLVVLAPFIAQLLGGLIPAASSFLTALAPLGPVLAALTPILAVLGEAFATVLLAALQALAPILVALTPLIAEFATQWAVGLASALTAATPLLVAVAEFLSRNAETMIWLVGVVGGVAAAFQPLLWVLGLVVSALAGVVIRAAALAILTSVGLQASLFGRAVMLLLSPMNLLQRALPLIGRALLFVGRAVLGALGPLGWLLTILGFLYTSNEQFRNAVNGLLAVLGQMVGQLISAVMPAFQQIFSAIAPLIPLLVSALMPVLDTLARVFIDLIATVLPPLVAFFTSQLLPVIVELADILATVLVWVITNVVVPAIQLLAWVISNVVAPVIMWLYENVVKPAFERIGALIAWTWANVIKPALDFFVWLLRDVLGPTIEWWWTTVVRPSFEAAGKLIAWVWENVIRPAFGALGDGLGVLGDSFDRTVRTIGDIWNGLRNLLAVPINFFIGTVYNNGIRKAWNLVADLLPGVGPLAELPLIPQFARGGVVPAGSYGVLPGYSPGRDTMLAAVGEGESWMRPEFTRGAGARWIHNANDVARRGGPHAVARFLATGGESLQQFADGGIVAAQNFVRSQQGKPYRWGGVGPAGYDCTGLLSAAANVALGLRPHSRRFATGSFQRNRGAGGFLPGTDSAFVIGVSPNTGGGIGHAAGNVGGLGIESRGGAGVLVGSAARSVTDGMFPWRFYLPQVGGEFAGGDGGGFFDWIGDQIRGWVTSITDPAINALRTAFPAPPRFMSIPAELAQTVRDKALDFFLGSAENTGTAGEPAGAGVQRWAPLVRQALGMLGQPDTLVQTTLRRMQQESGGNPRAINNWDSNARRGTPSKGLMQVIDPTFRAYRDARAANDIWDPLANVLASMKYALGRYGSLPRAYDRAGGYDSGGIARGVGWMWKGTGLDERVLPPHETQAYPTLTRLSQQLEAGRVPLPGAVSDAQWAAVLAEGRRGGDGAQAGDTFNITAREEHSEARIAREVQRQRDHARRTR